MYFSPGFLIKSLFTIHKQSSRTRFPLFVLLQLWPVWATRRHVCCSMWQLWPVRSPPSRIWTVTRAWRLQPNTIRSARLYLGKPPGLQHVWCRWWCWQVHFGGIVMQLVCPVLWVWDALSECGFFFLNSRVSEYQCLKICVTLQLASGAFGHIKDTVLSALNREPTMDISPETMGTLSMIMLAQAQEVIFLKAASGARLKPVIDVADIASCFLCAR